MRVIVTGSRDWEDDKPIHDALSSLPPDTVVLHGGARGADAAAGRIARGLGLEVHTYPAQWSRYGRAAGYLRNQEMLDSAPVDLVLAFPLPQSRGTWDMVERAKVAGVRVEVWEGGGFERTVYGAGL